MGGIPLFSQTPLYISWRTPEVGLRAHPFNLSVLMGVWRVGTAQLSFSGVEVSLCNPALCTTLLRQHLVSAYLGQHWGTCEGAPGLKAEKTRPVVDSCLSLSVELSKGNGESCGHNKALLSQIPFLFAQPCSTIRSLQTHCNSSPVLGCLAPPVFAPELLLPLL